MNIDKGIIPIVMGGLGNQMFIVSAAYVAHKYTDIPFYMIQDSPENNKHNLKKRDYNQSIFKDFEPKLPYPKPDNGFIQNLFILGYKPFCSGQSAFIPWTPNSVVPGSIFNNYYQYYPPLSPYESELREKFCKGLEEFRVSLVKQYSNLNTAAFLHIRRGDYLKHPTIHYNQTLDYYKQAIEKLLNANSSVKTIYILSDDINWAKEQPLFQSQLFRFFESDDELETMAFMSLCLGGAICANSTFSWWGAFLGAYEKRNPVIVPSKWISEPIYSLFPDEWIII